MNNFVFDNNHILRSLDDDLSLDLWHKLSPLIKNPINAEELFLSRSELDDELAWIVEDHNGIFDKQ